MSQSQNTSYETSMEMAFIHDYMKFFVEKSAAELSDHCQDMMEAKLEEAWNEMDKRLAYKFSQIDQLLDLVEEFYKKDQVILDLQRQLSEKLMKPDHN